MNKLLIIVTTCCISIILCACGESVPVVENNSGETIREEETTLEQVSHEDEEPVLWDNSDPEQWKQVYLNYLDTLKYADSYVYGLIYVDDDDIPELVIDYGFDYRSVDGGCMGILTYHGNVLDEWKPIFSRFTYIERGNLICNIYNVYGEKEIFYGDDV
ncbi:MAG: hypothetical protein K2M91_15310, partial [Lachnospiraceae bacterium]|nr:hypothetical protein [Lachnospiraceae bacterium]